jgi:hypothetical protein
MTLFRVLTTRNEKCFASVTLSDYEEGTPCYLVEFYGSAVEGTTSIFKIEE